MSNKYHNTQNGTMKPAHPPPVQPNGVTIPAPNFPQYPDHEQKGLGKV